MNEKAFLLIPSKEVTQEIERISSRLNEQKNQLNPKEIDEFIEEILKAKRVFLAGEGRSGMVAKAFGMRLMHLGFTVYVIGETTTPAFTEEDLLVVVSGSGENKIYTAQAALRKGSKLAGITSNKSSSLGRLADRVVIVPGRGKEEEIIDYDKRRLEGFPVALLGTLFEIFALVFLDSVSSYLAVFLEKTEDDLKERHASSG